MVRGTSGASFDRCVGTPPIEIYGRPGSLASNRAKAGRALIPFFVLLITIFIVAGSGRSP